MGNNENNKTEYYEALALELAQAEENGRYYRIKDIDYFGLAKRNGGGRLVFIVYKNSSGIVHHSHPFETPGKLFEFLTNYFKGSGVEIHNSSKEVLKLEEDEFNIVCAIVKNDK